MEILERNIAQVGTLKGRQRREIRARHARKCDAIEVCVYVHGTSIVALARGASPSSGCLTAELVCQYCDMEIEHSDPVFDGSVPEFYDRYLVPLIFEPYAADLVARLMSAQVDVVLEVAAGSGVLSRKMVAGLPHSTQLTVTDLNQPMIDYAKSVGTTRPVSWRQADVMNLPFPDDSFDAVVCQFGVMFFPDKAKAFAEVSRVLRPGGLFLFNVWDRIQSNEFADVVTSALGERYPDDPPLFLDRTPHGYFDHDLIRSDLVDAGFGAPEIDALAATSRADTCKILALAYCYGTPLRNEIEARDPQGLSAATDAAAAALGRRFGTTALESSVRGFVVSARTGILGNR
jgi:SAM-dependent methyltransferase